MAQDPYSNLPLEDPFQNKVIVDPFEEQHFGGTTTYQPPQSPYNTSSAANWSEKLPESSTTLVFGILALVGSFCYGIVGLIFGIIALSISGRPKRLYLENPTRYSQSSYSNLNAGRICAIIGIALSSLVILGALIVLGLTW